MAGGSCSELEAFDLRQCLAGQEGPGAWQLRRVTVTSRFSGPRQASQGGTGCMVNGVQAAGALSPLPTELGFEGSFHDAHAVEVKPPEAERK